MERLLGVGVQESAGRVGSAAAQHGGFVELRFRFGGLQAGGGILRRSRGVGLPGLVEEALQDIGTIGCRDGVHRESPPNDTHWVSMGDIGSGQENFSGIRKKLG